jgi:hypothetical protein
MKSLAENHAPKHYVSFLKKQRPQTHGASPILQQHGASPILQKE